MVRKHLSLQLVLVLVVVSLVPLLGAGFFTLHLIEGSLTHQVQSNHEQLSRAAGAMIQDYIKSAQTKLKNIAKDIEKNPTSDPEKGNRELGPPDLFFKVSRYRRGFANPSIASQAQQSAYNEAQLKNMEGNRWYDNNLKQVVENFSNGDSIISAPATGNDFISPVLETVENLPNLALSVPAARGEILVARLDFRPVSQMLSNIAGAAGRVLVLADSGGRALAASSPPSAAGARDFLTHDQPMGHGGWRIQVYEPRDQALAPLRQAREQALIWFGLACTLALGLAALFGSRVLRPIRSLARTADALGRGDFAARSGIERADEIGQLARSFDRMAAAIEELDTLKSEFVAHVSHELRTPLTSAKIALSNVQEGLAGKESLARVQEDLDRLIRMVNELLDVARIEAGLGLTTAPTDLGALVRSSVETLRPLARVSLEVIGGGDTLPLDAARIHQIIVNLVDNALKYAASRVWVEVQGREVRVSDDGPGVPPEARERIFEKFQKAGTGPQPPGAGLGLSIARKLAELHGGTLVCLGNTFLLRL